MFLWSLTPRLHLRPSRTPATEPYAITLDSTHRSPRLASWKRLSIMDSRVQAVWNTPTLSRISLNLSLCFHWTSVAFAYSVCSKTRTMLFNLSVNGSHVSSRCVNSQQISDDILWDLNLATHGNIESCPATGFLLLFCMKSH